MDQNKKDEKQRELTQEEMEKINGGAIGVPVLPQPIPIPIPQPIPIPLPIDPGQIPCW